VNSTTPVERDINWWVTRCAPAKKTVDGRAQSPNVKVSRVKRDTFLQDRININELYDLEIRCLPPEIPKNSSVVYNGNDRSFGDSFKVGSTVQYRCSQGHIVQGQSLRTCETSGHWSDAPPICVCKLLTNSFLTQVPTHCKLSLDIDCGLPFPLTNGKWLLTINSTYYGSTVEYECNNNYRLNGPGRRICLENGTWSSVPPICESKLFADVTL